jgi:hypothetical protein
VEIAVAWSLGIEGFHVDRRVEHRRIPVVELPEPALDHRAVGEIGVDSVVDGGVARPEMAEDRACGRRRGERERRDPVVVAVVEPPRRRVTVVAVERVVGRDDRPRRRARGEDHVGVPVLAPVYVLPDRVLEQPSELRLGAPDGAEREVSTDVVKRHVAVGIRLVGRRRADSVDRPDRERFGELRHEVLRAAPRIDVPVGDRHKGVPGRGHRHFTAP